MKKLFNLLVLACVFAGAVLSSSSLSAQTAVPPPTPDYQPLADQQLDQLLGPIALYPDPLIAVILPAATLPTQVVLADRYVQAGGDPSQIENQPWDSNVQALAHYPSVLKWMDDNLAWTTELGQAFLNQQPQVMDSIQRLRASAQNLGNLQSTPQQQVIGDGGYIEIVPVDPQIIYVPVYDPNSVFYQTATYGPFVTFGVGWGIGGWLNCDFDWGNHHLIIWGRNHPRPSGWWQTRGGIRAAAVASHGRVWQPSNHTGFVGGNRGDRGWNNDPAARQPMPGMTHSVPIHENHPSIVGPAIHSNLPGQSVPAQHFQSVNRSQDTSAFIGIQSSSATRAFSNRGEQSIQAATHSESHSEPRGESHSGPAPRPQPSSGGGNNGGGGNHSSGSHGH